DDMFIFMAHLMKCPWVFQVLGVVYGCVMQSLYIYLIAFLPVQKYLLMSNKMKIAPLMIDLFNTELDEEEKELLQHPFVGSVILFARNYVSPKQVSHLIQQIRQAKKAPILVAVDQEGGRVQRFKEPLTLLPPAGYFGELYEKSPERAAELALETG